MSYLTKEQEEQKREREKKDKDFVKFFRPYIDEIAKLARESPTSFDLFMLICKHMDGGNALCVSQQVLTELMNVSRQTISKSTKYLKDNGWICVMKSGTSNVYIINPSIAWTSYANQKQYCKFQSNVLLSATENNEFLRNPKATTRFKTIDTEFIKSVQKKKVEYENQTNKYNKI